VLVVAGPDQGGKDSEGQQRETGGEDVGDFDHVVMMPDAALRSLRARQTLAKGMDSGELHSWCLRQPGAIEDFPFGPEVSVFKVAGKMFALSMLERAPLEVSVKCEPELAAGLRQSYPAIRPGYHLNKRHWNTLTLDDSLPDQFVRELIEDSYDLVVSALPKRIREQLGWAPP
jgi:predicted DNA-binding protein (MmcQ/YjbR family)